MKSQSLFFIFLSTYLFSQSSFDYTRTWATYHGGTQTEIFGIYEDSSMNILVDAETKYPTIIQPSLDYYNQFIINGGQPFINTNSKNDFNGKLSSTGNLITAGYSPYTTSYAKEKSIIFRDQTGNRYEYEHDMLQYPTLSTGTWLPNPIANYDNFILSKYDATGGLLWKTYMPGKNPGFLKTDNDGNVYITGTTTWQNIGDIGTFQPTFTVSNSGGGLLLNSYVVKLNSQGQKIWGTYIPSKNINGIDVYSNNLYITGGNDLIDTNSLLSTAGTFQQTKANQSILKLDNNNGQRIWGTYYGLPGSGIDGVIANIKVTSSGVYILGTTSRVGTYYATEGAYKNYTADGFDLYITKFNNIGNRVWSTYLGSDSIDLLLFSSSKNLDVKDDKILVSGSTLGSQNIATSGSFISTKPNPNDLDLFFSMFNASSGANIFTSYYGGTSVSGQGSNINCQFSQTQDSFYLYGATERNIGYSTPNGYQANIIYPSGVTKGTSGYIAKFSTNLLSTSEMNSSKGLTLYNNPNNGNFSIKGELLTKESHSITIVDMSGRLIHSQSLQKKAVEYFELENKLMNGNYILTISKTDKTVIKSFNLMIKK